MDTIRKVLMIITLLAISCFAASGVYRNLWGWKGSMEDLISSSISFAYACQSEGMSETQCIEYSRRQESK